MSQVSPSKPEQITCEQFFKDVVPRILKATAAKRKQLKGVATLTLTGGEKALVYTVDLDRGVVFDMDTGLAGFHLEMPEEDFTLMLEDKADIEELLRSGRIRCSGDPKILFNLSAVLRPTSMEY